MSTSAAKINAKPKRKKARPQDSFAELSRMVDRGYHYAMSRRGLARGMCPRVK